jgi:hypothetical protein
MFAVFPAFVYKSITKTYFSAAPDAPQWFCRDLLLAKGLKKKIKRFRIGNCLDFLFV